MGEHLLDRRAGDEDALGRQPLGQQVTAGVLGDASKAKRILGWSPKTTFAELVSLMAKADFEALRDDAKTPKMFY